MTWRERAKAASETLVASYQSLPRPPSFPSLPIDSLPRSLPTANFPFVSQLPLPSWLAPAEPIDTEDELEEQLDESRVEQLSSSKEKLLEEKEKQALELLQSQVCSFCKGCSLV